MNLSFTVHRSPFPVRYPFTQHLARKTMRFRLSAGLTLIHDPWLMVNSAVGDNLPRPLHLDAAQGASEKRKETYRRNTSSEYHSWQRSDAPRATGAAGWAGWQGGGAEGVG